MKTRKLLSILLTCCLLFALAAPVCASTFTDAHGNVIELDDTLEAYAEAPLYGADDAARKRETNLGDLWTDALRWFAASGKINEFFEEDDVTAGNNAVAVDADHIVALWNGGNLRDDIPVGKFNAETLANVLPYPNKVAVVYMTGAELLEALEAASQALPYSASTAAGCASFMQVSGLKYTLDLSKPYDKGEEYKAPWYKAASVGRVTITEVNGQAFDPAAVYAVITSNANFNGMDSSYIFKAAAAADDKSTVTTAVVRDVVWMYLKDKLGGTVSADYAAPQGRITIKGEPAETAGYPDVPAKAWFAPYVTYVTEAGLMVGMDGGFNPKGVTTRAQLVAVIYRLAGSPDVEAEGGKWYAKARAWAVAEGISDGERMEDTLTRQEAVAMLYRYAQKQGKGFVGMWYFPLDYPDAGEVSSWADEAMHWMVMNKVISGKDGKLAPKDTLTRAEMAVILKTFTTLPEADAE